MTVLTLARFHALVRDRAVPSSVSLRSSAPATVTAPDRRVVSFVFSDNSVDSYGDTIAAAGWDLAAFKANPVALYGHDPSKAENVIGRAENVRVSGNRLLGDIVFAEAAINPVAETVYQLLRGGFLNAVSVGFVPIEWKLSTDPKRLGGVDFTRQKLAEISVVAIPSNSNALVTARAVGIDCSSIDASASQRPEATMYHRTAPGTMTPAAVSRALRARSEEGLYAFRTLGEQLQAIARSTIMKKADDRLVRAPAGASEGAPSAGGFLVQSNFAEQVLWSAYDEAVLAPLCWRPEYRPEYGTLGGGVKMPAIDESSRVAGSRYGGVMAYWASEAANVPASMSRLKQVVFTDRKLIGVMYATNEMLNDAALLGDFAARAFGAEFSFKLDEAILKGSAGTPLGLLSSTALITIAKEVGQGAGSIVKENIDKMWARLPIPSRRRAVWLIHEDVEGPLASLSGPQGSSGSQMTYTPRGTVPGTAYAFVNGAPVLPIEQASVPGAVGDITLADLSHYILLDGGINPAISVHFSFDNDQAVFRFVLHVDGKPEFTSPITPYSGTTPRSPFVTLAAR